MALKVLLADDSAAIRKVVQLSLQDLGLEITMVGTGPEVLEAAKKFKPDIALIDVLLPQKPGYDVAVEMKRDAATKSIPLVLLWSAFMAFDEAKFQISGADAKLEKPFEAAGLRELVSRLVPTVSAGKVASFDQQIGTVPPARKIPTAPPAPPQQQAAAPIAPPSVATPAASQPTLARPTVVQPTLGGPPPPPPAAAMDSAWTMSAFEDIQSFSNKVEAKKPEEPAKKPLEMNPEAPLTPDPSSWVDDNEWIKKDLGKFSVPPPTEEPESPSFEYSDSKIIDTSFLFKTPGQETAVNHSPAAALEPLASALPDTESSESVVKNLSVEDLAELKLQTREIIESVVWKIVPDLASQIIKEELNRLLSEEP